MKDGALVLATAWVMRPDREARLRDPCERSATFAGLIQPNSQVDVLVLLHDNGGQGRHEALIVAQDLRVLALGVVIGRSSDSSFTRNAVVTLEVTPEQAELLATAGTDGQIKLMLRGQGDSVRLR